MAIKKTYMKLKKKAFGSKGVRGRYDPRRAGAKSLLNLYRDVKMIQSRLNVEKKFIDKDVSTEDVGQVNGNLPGYVSFDVTPNMAQGVGSANRIGNSIKFTGISIPIQFSGSLSCVSARKLRVMLLRVNAADNGVTQSEAIADYLDPNPINGLIDYQSQKAYRTDRHDGIKLLRSQTYFLPAATTMVGNDDFVDDVERSSISIKFNVKLQDTLRFTNNAATLPDGTSYYLYIFADKGNKSAGTASTLDVPVLSPLTGVGCRIATRQWYVDN